jgi:hypothetical protein
LYFAGKTNSFDVNQEGVYTVLINSESCVDGYSCPFIIEEDCDCEDANEVICAPFIINKKK